MINTSQKKRKRKRKVIMNEQFRRDCNKMKKIYYIQESKFDLFKNSYSLNYLNELSDNYKCARMNNYILCIKMKKFFTSIITCGPD